MSDLNKIRESRAAKEAEYNEILTGDFTPEARERADVLKAQISAMSERETELADAEKRAAAAAKVETFTAVTESSDKPEVRGYENQGRVTKEERTYTAPKQREGISFFSDAWNAQRGNTVAQERIDRHAKEVTVEGEISKRALATGGVAGLVIPQYLADMAALVLRAGRPLANAVNRHQIPDAGMTLYVPRGTTGASAAIQATENSATSSTDEVWTNVSVPVVTIAGQQQVSRQALERGESIDEIVFTDLVRAYATQVDAQLISGTGSAGQMLGILNTAGIGAATAFGAAPTTTNFTLKVVGQRSSVDSAGAGVFAKAIVMHPRRYNWLAAQVDTTGRPVVSAAILNNFNAAAVGTTESSYSQDLGASWFASAPIGIHNPTGLPIITDLNIPTNVGTNVEDVVLVLDTTEIHLWEDGDGLPRQLTFEQTAGNNLTTTLVAYNYVAGTAGRYPLAVGKVGGLDTVATQGLVAPSF